MSGWLAVDKIGKAVCVKADWNGRVGIFDVLCHFANDVDSFGWLAIAAEDDFGEVSEIMLIKRGDYFVERRLVIEPERV